MALMPWRRRCDSGSTTSSVPSTACSPRHRVSAATPRSPPPAARARRRRRQHPQRPARRPRRPGTSVVSRPAVPHRAARAASRADERRRADRRRGREERRPHAEVQRASCSAPPRSVGRASCSPPTNNRRSCAGSSTTCCRTPPRPPAGSRSGSPTNPSTPDPHPGSECHTAGASATPPVRVPPCHASRYSRPGVGVLTRSSPSPVERLGDVTEVMMAVVDDDLATYQRLG